MKATTIKLEGSLLAELEQVKRKGQSLTGFVKELLASELQRRQLRKAAERYSTFLREHEEENDWLEQWADADLANAPKRKR